MPLILQLVNLESEQKAFGMIGTSANPAENERVTNLDDIPALITKYTSQLAGSGIGVSPTPIYLRVSRYNSCDLTIIDLPGIARVPLKGQPANVYEQIRGMIETHIKSEEAVILAVMASNVDFATCESVQLARQFDPNGQRTLCIVTKMDLAESYMTNGASLGFLQSRLSRAVQDINLKLGIVCVKCRSQEETERGISWEMSRKAESAFFASHVELGDLWRIQEGTRTSMSSPALNALASNVSLGVGRLATILAGLLEQRIRSTFPRIRQQVDSRLVQDRDALKALPEHVHGAVNARSRYDRICGELITSLTNLIQGDRATARGDTSMHISARFHEQCLRLQSKLNDSLSNFFTVLYAREVDTERSESAGITLPNFVPSIVFTNLIQKEVHKFEEPAKEYMASLHGILQNCIRVLCDSHPHLSSFPPLKSRMLMVCSEFIDDRFGAIRPLMQDLMEMQYDTYSVNPIFLDTVDKLRRECISVAEGKSRGVINVNHLRVPLDPDFLHNVSADTRDVVINVFVFTKMVIGRLVDDLALMVRHHVLRSLRMPFGLSQAMQSWLPQDPEVLVRLFAEPPELATERQRLTRSVAHLEEASKLFATLF